MNELEPDRAPDLDPDRAEETVGASAGDVIPSRAFDRVPTVGLGGSAGSIPALTKFFEHMPPDSGMAFVVVIHLAPEHDSHLADVLQRATRMPVVRVASAVTIEPNHVYVIPPGHALRAVDGELMLDETVTDRGRHVAVDLFFRTLGEVYGPRGVAIVLSGLDSDGAIGLKRVKERGGLAVAEDPNEAEHGGMPRAAIATGMVDWVLPVAEMPARLIEYRRLEHELKLPREDGPAPATTPASSEDDEAALRDVLVFLRTRTGRDFSSYKRATIVRRIARRMQVAGVQDLRAYLQCLRTLPGEAGALLQDLLISVTNFFRDSHCFAALEAMVPTLFRGKGLNDRVRVWVAACATGEEAYSIAMLLHEHASTLESPPLIQVFATDLDDQAIQAARNGLYPATIEADVSAERLRRFFVKEHLGYRVRRELRETVLFAVHDVLKDSPFSRLDLVSCRNLLIYLSREMQARVLDTFHFALRGDGVLFLGSSETVDDGSPLFAVAHKRHRLYVRRSMARTTMPVPTGPGTLARWVGDDGRPAVEPAVPVLPVQTPLAPAQAAAPTPRIGRRDPNAASWAEMHFKLLERLAPPSVIIDKEHEIVHLSPSAGQFLQLTGGEPTTNLLRLVHPSLRIELRAAIFQAAQHGSVAEIPWTSIEMGGESREVAVRVAPVDEANHEYFLVIFDAHRRVAGEQPAAHEPDRVAEQLDREVERLKSHLRDTVEQYEASNEELKASNEELQAMNEELRSATEELETGCEELQSINEELSTVNHELKVKVEELGSSNSDMLNLMDATSIPTVFLDRSLRVTRFTPAAVGVFNLIPSDVGRPLTDLRTELDYATLAQDASRVLDRLVPIEREITRAGGQSWYMARLLPYRTVDDRIAGVVLTLVDITERRQAAEAARASEERLRLIVDNAHDYAIFSMDPTRRVTSWNPGAERLVGYTEREMLGETADILFTPEQREAGVPKQEADTALAQGRAGDDRVHVRKDGTRFWASGTLMPMRNAAGELVGYVKILRDMTEARETQEALERSRAELLEALQGTDRARREAELQKEHLSALFSQAPMPICILRGPEHLVEFANPRMGALWGRDTAKVIGKPVFEAVSRLRVTLDAKALSAVMSDGTSHIAKEVAARMPRNERGPLEDVYLNFTYAPLRDVSGEIDGVLVMASDVTDEVRGREQMSELHDAEQAASRAKDDFLAMLGHELRNPLAPLRNALHLLRQGDGADEKALLDIADRQAGNLSRIVDDLLEAARITEGKIDLRLEDVDLADVVKRAIESARPVIDQHEHAIAASLPNRPVLAHVDPVRIEQVVFNLLSNAAKYTPTGGRIEVALRRLGKVAEIRVVDNGIGIPAELHPRLFQLFQQGERPLSREGGGLGIGLSVVRHLVALHGGSVEARSDGAGKGSAFIVRLPVAAARAEAAPAPSQPAAPAAAPVRTDRPMRVVVVDDNHDAGVTLQMVIEGLGHEARLAHDGPAALELCADWKPDVVFLDLGLPGMDGYEVARELRKRLAEAAPRLVAVTGYGQESDRAKTREAGFDRHLVKPATFDAIRSALAGVPSES